MERHYHKLTEQLVFAIVMRDEEVCKELIERIIPNRKIKAIRFAKNELMDSLAQAISDHKEKKPRELTRKNMFSLHFFQNPSALTHCSKTTVFGWILKCRWKVKLTCLSESATTTPARMWNPFIQGMITGN